ncbi:MAG: FkbM family methyltransferase [Pseudoxanthomonas sp.]
MDDLLADSEVPVLIKIDVEGHEGAVLHGAQRTLADRRVAAVLMEVNGSGMRYGVSDDALLSMMCDHGFKAFSYDPLARELREWESVKGNAIFVRDMSVVNDRLKSAKSYRLVNGSI